MNLKFLMHLHFVLILAAIPSVCLAQSSENGSLLPEFTMPVPEESNYRVYLGLNESADKTFSVYDIDTDILMIELFSMYCPFCQEEAPAVNELYELAEKLPETGPQFKIIGLGANNSSFEVNHFRATFDIAFPLFSDKDMALYKLLKGAGTPGFIVAKRGVDGTFSIIHQQSGGFNGAEQFLREMLAKAEK